MNKIILIIICIIFFNFSILFADDWEEKKNVAKNIKSVSAKFTQEKHLKILKKPLISKGKFFFTAPGLFPRNSFAPGDFLRNLPPELEPLQSGFQGFHKTPLI